MYEIGFQIVSDKKLIIIPEKQGPGSLVQHIYLSKYISYYSLYKDIFPLLRPLKNIQLKPVRKYPRVTEKSAPGSVSAQDIRASEEIFSLTFSSLVLLFAEPGYFGINYNFKKEKNSVSFDQQEEPGAANHAVEIGK